MDEHHSLVNEDSRTERRARYRLLLDEDTDLRRWYDNLCRGSRVKPAELRKITRNSTETPGFHSLTVPLKKCASEVEIQLVVIIEASTAIVFYGYG